MPSVEEKIGELRKQLKGINDELESINRHYLNTGYVDTRTERLQTNSCELHSQIEELAYARHHQVRDSLRFLYDQVARHIMDPELSGGCLKILNSDRFRVCPAARKQHQAFDGGLIVHTAQVLEAALLMSQSGFIKADKQIITTAVIYHDCAKVYDYFPAKDGADPRYEYTSHQKLIRHLPRSYAVFMSDTEGKVAEDIREQIAHCILAHHGRKEWGSPVEPLTTEANIIHMADMLSANCALDIY